MGVQDSHYTRDYLITGRVDTAAPFVCRSWLNNTLHIFGGPVPKQQSGEVHKALFNLSKYQRAAGLRARVVAGPPEQLPVDIGCADIISKTTCEPVRQLTAKHLYGLVEQQRSLVHALRKGLVRRTPETEALREEQHSGGVVDTGQPEVKVCGDAGELPEREGHGDWDTGAPEQLSVAVEEGLVPEQRQLGAIGRREAQAKGRHDRSHGDYDRRGGDGGGSGRGLEREWGSRKGPKYVLDGPLEGTHHGIGRKHIEPFHNAVGVHHRWRNKATGKRATGAGPYHHAPVRWDNIPGGGYGGQPIYRAGTSGKATHTRNRTGSLAPSEQGRTERRPWILGLATSDAIHCAAARRRHGTAVPASSEAIHRAAARKRQGTARPRQIGRKQRFQREATQLAGQRLNSLGSGSDGTSEWAMTRAEREGTAVPATGAPVSGHRHGGDEGVVVNDAGTTEHRVGAWRRGGYEGAAPKVVSDRRRLGHAHAQSDFVDIPELDLWVAKEARALRGTSPETPALSLSTGRTTPPEPPTSPYSLTPCIRRPPPDSHGPGRSYSISTAPYPKHYNARKYGTPIWKGTFRCCLPGLWRLHTAFGLGSGFRKFRPGPDSGLQDGLGLARPGSTRACPAQLGLESPARHNTTRRSSLYAVKRDAVDRGSVIRGPGDVWVRLTSFYLVEGILLVTTVRDCIEVDKFTKGGAGDCSEEGIYRADSQTFEEEARSNSSEYAVAAYLSQNLKCCSYIDEINSKICLLIIIPNKWRAATRDYDATCYGTTGPTVGYGATVLRHYRALSSSHRFADAI
ncbi:hypothetical protein CERSUDRAFT_71718 [Gelatoporia subvermispora B]|uniref:Uncharacterized protein n=1 Tax=Ceriporiopsis subvermispora (strain B) TaxID=914234 RepID=M2QRZ9_CERS8|nr:hypothetical protein CERSUDRAFT_71718 [Gelatoporia subvermispora B]